MRQDQLIYKFARTASFDAYIWATAQFYSFCFLTLTLNLSGSFRCIQIWVRNEMTERCLTFFWFRDAMRNRLHILVFIALQFFMTLNMHVFGQELDTELNESVLIIPKKQLFTINLEATLYKPDGLGPFPIVLINHGKTGQARDHDRYRPTLAARYFLQRGYAVVVPMRQGFSKSEGNYVGSSCDAEGNGFAQADDLQATLDHVLNQSWAAKTQVIVVGQSQGGWATLAFGAKKYPGVKGLINFAGGVSNPNCIGWESSLASAAATYAKATDIPSLWFYGDNDSYFNPTTYRAMYDQYQKAGGQARLVSFGIYKVDSHTMFSEREGAPIWQPQVTNFLKLLGMPSDPNEAYSKFANTYYIEPPSPSNYAALTDISKIPYVRDTGRAGYKEYLMQTPPRAFAIAKNGVWAWSNDGDDPLKRSLERCSSISKLKCSLYSVDENIVWIAE